jgi:hypothetical protein
MRTLRFVCWLALPVGLLIGGMNAASAQGSEEARQACTPDAMRLCSEFIPDAGKVKNCMLRKRGQLSETCRTAMRGGGRRYGHGRYRRVRHVRYRRHRG